MEYLINMDTYRAKMIEAMEDGYLDDDTVEVMVNILDCEPAIDAKPVVRGHWVFSTAFEVFGGDEDCWHSHGNPIASIHCSECGFEPYTGIGSCAYSADDIEAISNYKRCPECGAFMDVVVAENATTMDEEGGDTE